jgi:hypothetical protein
MSLAQVVYKISNDTDFATQWRRDPKAALSNKGFDLSREEFAFLTRGLRRVGFDEGRTLSLSELDILSGSWKD